MVHHQRQQLVLQPLLGHAEVDERGLGRGLGREVRVGDLGGQVEPEARVVLHLGIADLQQQRPPALDDLGVAAQGQGQRCVFAEWWGLEGWHAGDLLGGW